MPKRTNEFQQLIYLIRNQLSETSTVTESMLLTDTSTGESVEVDIVIEANTDSIPVLIGFECTAQKRPADRGWVNNMIGKHQTLPTDKVLLVSKSGFTEGAIKRAKSANIPALTIEVAKDTDWLKFIRDLGNLKMGSFNFTPYHVRSYFQTVGEDTPVEIEETSKLRVPDNGFNASITDYVVQVINRPDVVDSLIRKWLKTPKDERKKQFDLTINIRPNSKTEVLANDETWRILDSMEVTIKVEIRTTPLALDKGAFDGYHIAFGTAENIFPEPPLASPSVIVNILGQGGAPIKASIMFPGSANEDAEILDLRFPKETRDSDKDE